jgi:hypothetical protein
MAHSRCPNRSNNAGSPQRCTHSPRCTAPLTGVVHLVSTKQPMANYPGRGDVRRTRFHALLWTSSAGSARPSAAPTSPSPLPI